MRTVYKFINSIIAIDEQDTERVIKVGDPHPDNPPLDFGIDVSRDLLGSELELGDNDTLPKGAYVGTLKIIFITSEGPDGTDYDSSVFTEDLKPMLCPPTE